ncbi:hypothetical protein DH2020_039727 [Rehmannia glutinosa]|uniref:Transcription repressor n=1 Tax=Rehmannia glutinosa TaxID=99300 RepID=A0ABR0UVQ9_REHGL
MAVAKLRHQSQNTLFPSHHHPQRHYPRLFFEPGETKSILEEAKTPKSTRTEEGVAIVEIDSRDPFLDFRVSMEEMVAAAHDGIKDNWGFLEELLACYLRFNCKSNHGYIVGAFLDLVIRLSLGSDFSDEFSFSAADGVAAAAIDENCFSSSTTVTDQYSFTSPLSFSSSTDSSASQYCLSSLENIDDEILIGKNGGGCNLSSFLYNASSSGV